MLNKTELQQLLTAIDAMASYKMNKTRLVSANNVKALIERWSEKFYEQDKEQDTLGIGTLKRAIESSKTGKSSAQEALERIGKESSLFRGNRR